MVTCPDCGDLSRGQHDVDCLRIVSDCDNVQTRQTDLHRFAAGGQ